MALMQSITQRARDVFGQDCALISALRPAYARFLERRYARRGLPWSINGQPFRIAPQYRRQMATDYDRDVAEALAKRVNPGDCCFDVGANVGVYALQLAAWSGSNGSVFAFEPNPATRTVLQRHIDLNGFGERVKVVPLAAGNASGKVSFTSSGTSGMSRVGAVNPLLANEPDVIEREVERTTIDEFCAQRGVRPNVLFIDVEGHEIAVLQGCRETIRAQGASMLIAVELHPDAWANAGSSRRELEELLEEFDRRAVTPWGKNGDLDAHEIVFLEPKHS